MILFLIKKTFFDFWDNLIPIILLNIGFLLIFLGEVYLLGVLLKLGNSFFVNNPTILSLFLYVCICAGSVVFSIYAGTAAKIVKKIADFEIPKFTDFLINLRETYKASSMVALIFVTYFFVFFIAGRFYLNTTLVVGGFNVGIIIFTMLFFISLLILLASQYFFPLQSNFDLNVKKNLKKMFLILYDNTGFSILLFVLNGIVVVLSILTFFVFFGITINILLCMVAFKLRLYKYDYFEKHPNANRRVVPWNELLSDDMEMVGKRTLRGMIFPWKN